MLLLGTCSRTRSAATARPASSSASRRGTPKSSAQPCHARCAHVSRMLRHDPGKHAREFACGRHGTHTQDARTQRMHTRVLHGSNRDVSETVGTLEFGSRALNVVLKATINTQLVELDPAKLAADMEQANAVPCHAMPCAIVPCRAVPCRAVPCRVQSCRAAPCRVQSCHAVPCRAMPCAIVPCHAVCNRAVRNRARVVVHVVVHA